MYKWRFEQPIQFKFVIVNDILQKHNLTLQVSSEL